MGQQIVSITLDDHGWVALAPAAVRVKRGDIVRWTSSHRFALHFGERTPFQPASSGDGKGGAVSIRSSQNVAQRTVAQDAPLGSYGYVVAVCGDVDVEIGCKPCMEVEC